MNLKIKNIDNQEAQGITRRKLLQLGLLTAAAIVVPDRVVNAAAYILPDTRSLSLYNAHTNEYFNSIYWQNGRYLPETMKTLEYMFRDHYNGQERPIDTKLIELLHEMQKNIGTQEPFHLISGYRSSATNAALRRRNVGVAKKSLHIYGMAADIRLPGYSLKKLRRSAYELKAGGVGYYAKSNFVHVDVGRVRYW